LCVNRKTKICRHCGNAFVQTSGSRRKGWYCSRKCAAMARVIKAKSLADRTKIANAPADGMLACAKSACRGLTASKRERSGTVAISPQVSICGKCGVSIRRGIRVCLQCKRKTDILGRKRAKLLRRMRTRTQYIEHVVSAVVFERDSWMCCICGRQCAREYNWNNPMSPTVDHIHPLSKGGEHSYANCRTACARCNTVKSDSVIESTSLTGTTYVRGYM
jgi:5-methylcytosine-specific restriction endonuclease McrA